MRRIITFVILMALLSVKVNAQKTEAPPLKYKRIVFKADSTKSFNSQPLVAYGIIPNIKNSPAYLEIRQYTYSDYSFNFFVDIIQSFKDSISFERDIYIVGKNLARPANMFKLYRKNVKLPNEEGDLYKNIYKPHTYSDTILGKIVDSHIFDIPNMETNLPQSAHAPTSYFEVKLGKKYRNLLIYDGPFQDNTSVSTEYSNNARKISELITYFENSN